MSNGQLPETARDWHIRIRRLTWPVILANLTIPLVGVADVAVMGQLPDPAFIGAVAMGAALFSAIYWLFGFLRMGTTGLAAQCFGRDATAEAGAVFMRAAATASLLGVGLIILQHPIEALLFSLFSASEQTANLAQTYFSLRIYSAPAVLLYLVELGLLFGMQRMRETLILSVALNLTNLILDLVFVLGLDMGIRGVAIGTLISEWGAAVSGLWIVWRCLKSSGWQPARPKQLWESKAVSALFHVSSNLLIRTFFVQLPFFVGVIFATRAGDLTLAAHGVLMQIFFVTMYALDALAHTAETLAGYSYGAENRRALRRTLYYCGLWAGMLATITALLILFLGDWFIHGLTQNAQVRNIAQSFLPWLALTPLTCAGAFLLDGIFVGTTHVTQMRNAMAVAALVWAGSLYLSAELLGYNAVWLSMSIFMVTRTLLLSTYYPRLERSTEPSQ